MLRINQQLGQSLRTINIILFVRLQKRDGMTWISIFKPVPPVCVTKGSDPMWECKVASALLPVSVQWGGSKKHGEVWQEPAQTGLQTFMYSGWGGRGGEITSSRSGAGVRIVCVARGCEQPLSPSFSNVHLRLAELQGPGDLGPERPQTCWSGTPFFPGSVSSLGDGGQPLHGATLIVWPSAHTLLCLSPQVSRARACPGWKQARKPDQWGDPAKMHKILQNKIKPKLFQNGILKHSPKSNDCIASIFTWAGVCVCMYDTISLNKNKKKTLNKNMSEWIFMNLIDSTRSQFCCFYFHLGAFSCLLIKSVLNTLQAH